jgi:hypothetical protein
MKRDSSFLLHVSLQKDTERIYLDDIIPSSRKDVRTFSVSDTQIEYGERIWN